MFKNTYSLHVYKLKFHKTNKHKKKLNPFHVISLFVYPLLFSGGIERDRWHEIG